MAVKSQKYVNDNILYIQDTEALALGIIEGSAQKVFVNGKEVDIVYVDEHQVLSATDEEKKVYRDAFKIASKYSGSYEIGGTKTWNRNLVSYTPEVKHSHKYDENSKEETKIDFLAIAQKMNPVILFQKMKNSKFAEKVSSLWTRESMEHDGHESTQHDAITTSKPQTASNKKPKPKSKSKKPVNAAAKLIKNDAFTVQELEVIQNILDKPSKTASTKVTTKALVTTKNKKPTTKVVGVTKKTTKKSKKPASKKK